jgi:hypothetical protein
MIPKEVDDLMWSVAEANDPTAIEEFGDRYPNYRDELLKRMRTVKALKAGSKLPRSGAVPVFRNTQVQPTNWRLIWATFGFAILALFAFGIFRLTNHEVPPTNVAPINVEAPKLPEANVAVQSNNEMRPMTVPQPNDATASNSPIGPPTTLDEANIVPQSQGNLKDVKLESAQLQAAILMIADAGHFSVTFGPGMPNPTVNLNFEKMAPMDMLRALGEQYAFTPVEDGLHSVLIIPKKDVDEDQISSENR